MNVTLLSSTTVQHLKQNFQMTTQMIPLLVFIRLVNDFANLRLSTHTSVLLNTNNYDLFIFKF